CRDLLHYINLKIALGQQLLELRVLLLELSQALHIGRLELPEPLAPGIDRDVTDSLLLGERRDRSLVRLAKDLLPLFFCESTSSHCSSDPRSHHVPMFQMARKSAGMSASSSRFRHAASFALKWTLNMSA